MFYGRADVGWEILELFDDTRSIKIVHRDHTLGGSLRIKMDDPEIKRSIFVVKHDGSIEFLINEKTFVQNMNLLVKK